MPSSAHTFVNSVAPSLMELRAAMILPVSRGSKMLSQFSMSSRGAGQMGQVPDFTTQLHLH